MGIFSRFRDIISSNINSMLDKAEDPEKLVRLMIQEMEDTLVEIKASCAAGMATRKRIDRDCGQCSERADEWSRKAKLAIDRGREDLAREALFEQRRFRDRLAVLEKEKADCQHLIDQYQEDIRQLEDKLESAKEKRRLLIQRHLHASQKKRAQSDIRKMDNSDVFVRFEQFEGRIDRMEAEADLVKRAPKPTLDDEFSKLEEDEEIEKELARLKGNPVNNTGQGTV